MITLQFKNLFLSEDRLIKKIGLSANLISFECSTPRKESISVWIAGELENAALNLLDKISYMNSCEQNSSWRCTYIDDHFLIAFPQPLWFEWIVCKLGSWLATVCHGFANMKMVKKPVKTCWHSIRTVTAGDFVYSAYWVSEDFMYLVFIHTFCYYDIWD